MARFRKDQTVGWNWGAHRAFGHVIDIFTRKVRRTIKGRRITRKGTARRPAYLIRQDDGAVVLKPETELFTAPHDDGGRS